MIVSCPECKTRYRLSDAQIGVAGRSVRCIKCEHEWFQAPAKVETKAPFAPIAPDSSEKDKIAGSRQSRLKKAQDKFKQNVLATVVSIVIGIAVISITGFGLYSWFGEEYNTQASELPKSWKGLSIYNIEREMKEGDITILEFTGSIVNDSEIPIEVPTVKVKLLDAKGVEIDFWPVQLEKEILEPHETTDWVCRFFDPPLSKISEYKVGFSTP